MKKTLIITAACLLLMFGFVLPAQAAQRIIVYYIDSSGSFQLHKKAVEIGKNIVRDMSPGDILYVRLIHEESFTHRANVFRLQLPLILKPPKNRFNQLAWLRYHRARQAVLILKAKAIKLLADLKPMNSQKTDIWGALAGAADRFKAENRPDQRRYLIIASDMLDNRKMRCEIELMQAQVYIVAFQSLSNPRDARWLQRYWTQILTTKCNAKSVRWVPPDANFRLPKSQ